MNSRRNDVARLAGVPVEHVIPINTNGVRLMYSDRAPNDVLEVACSGKAETGEPCFYWRIGSTCYLDDATFGEVVAIDDLRYDRETGLYDRRWK